MANVTDKIVLLLETKVVLQMTKTKTNVSLMMAEAANWIDARRLRRSDTNTLDAIRLGRCVSRTTYHIHIIDLGPFLGELYLHLIPSNNYRNQYRMLTFQKQREGEL
jgi:hypothetical protein